MKITVKTVNHEMENPGTKHKRELKKETSVSKHLYCKNLYWHIKQGLPRKRFHWKTKRRHQNFQSFIYLFIYALSFFCQYQSSAFFQLLLCSHCQYFFVVVVTSFCIQKKKLMHLPNLDIQYLLSLAWPHWDTLSLIHQYLQKLRS